MKLLITADLHLRSTVPTCRKEIPEEWENRQINLLKNIYQLKIEHEAELVIVGDLFDTSIVPPWIVNMFLEYIPEATIIVGNHDYKFRNTSEILNSSIGHILKNPKYKIIDAEDKEIVFMDQKKTVALTHQLVFPPSQKGLAKFESGISSTALIEKARKLSLETLYVLCGDNHSKFNTVHKDILLVNPGSPLRISANQKDDTCGVFLLDTVKSSLKFFEIEDDAELVTDEYLRKAEKRSQAISTFIKKVSKTSSSDDSSMDFWEKTDAKIKVLNKQFRKEHNEIKQICEGVKSE